MYITKDHTSSRYLRNDAALRWWIKMRVMCFSVQLHFNYVLQKNI